MNIELPLFVFLLIRLSTAQFKYLYKTVCIQNVYNAQGIQNVDCTMLNETLDINRVTFTVD